MTNVLFGALAAAILAGCAATPTEAAKVPESPQPPQAIVEAPPIVEEPVARPRERMDRKHAEAYALSLINHDRKAAGLEPVTWDPVASRAAERHAKDLATHGFTAHIGTDGSVPEQRYTAAGGLGLVMENVGCFGDAQARELDPNPTFAAADVERVEQAFMNEVPPNDGHRRNILTRWHSGVGVALAQAKGVDLACMAQEFVDDYGSFEALPRHARLGAKLRIAGSVRAPASVAGIGISRVDRPSPKKAADLNQTHGYPIPKPYVTYFPKGYKTPIVLNVEGSKFWIEAPLSDADKAGLYGVSVWATFPGSKELVMISLRTIEVE